MGIIALAVLISTRWRRDYLRHSMMSQSLTFRCLMMSRCAVSCSCLGMLRPSALRPDGPVRKFNLSLPRVHVLYWQSLLLCDVQIRNCLQLGDAMLHVYWSLVQGCSCSPPLRYWRGACHDRDAVLNLERQQIPRDGNLAALFKTFAELAVLGKYVLISQLGIDRALFGNFFEGRHPLYHAGILELFSFNCGFLSVLALLINTGVELASIRHKYLRAERKKVSNFDNRLSFSTDTIVLHNGYCTSLCHCSALSRSWIFRTWSRWVLLYLFALKCICIILQE